MPIMTLPAHFDGERICLNEPFDLKPDAKLIITILPKEEYENEHEAWVFLSGQRLEDAYGGDEPEYSSALLKEVNLSYEAR